MPVPPASQSSFAGFLPAVEPPLVGAAALTPEFFPIRGMLTFEAEGSSSPESAYYSRVAHHPGESSGVTIGRGYDMRFRSRLEIVDDLTRSGIALRDAKKFSLAAGLYGAKAAAFIKANSLAELTQLQEGRLFEITYEQAERDVVRILAKSDVVNTYGEASWNDLNPSIREILTDLRFRGDYTPAIRRVIQPAVTANDIQTFAKLISDRSYWPGVPRDRFERRAHFISEALPG